MKHRYKVLYEKSCESSGNEIKSFKNEPEALAFYEDPKNLRQYGSMVLSRTDSQGNTMTFNDRTRSWITE